MNIGQQIIGRKNEIERLRELVHNGDAEYGGNHNG